jgi:hypothetical protein
MLLERSASEREARWLQGAAEGRLFELGIGIFFAICFTFLHRIAQVSPSSPHLVALSILQQQSLARVEPPPEEDAAKECAYRTFLQCMATPHCSKQGRTHEFCV